MPHLGSPNRGGTVQITPATEYLSRATQVSSIRDTSSPGLPCHDAARLPKLHPKLFLLRFMGMAAINNPQTTEKQSAPMTGGGNPVVHPNDPSITPEERERREREERERQRKQKQSK